MDRTDCTAATEPISADVRELLPFCAQRPGGRRRFVEPPDWREIEDAFRVWLFGKFYRHALRDEPDHYRRFARAIVASSRPLGDPPAIVRWYRARREEGNALTC